MLTTFFVALVLHPALLLQAVGDLQRPAAQNWNDTTLLKRGSNSTDVVFDNRVTALVARNPMIGRLFGKRPPTPVPPPAPHSVHKHVIVKLHRIGSSWVAPMKIGPSPWKDLHVLLDTDSACFWVNSHVWSDSWKAPPPKQGMRQKMGLRPKPDLEPQIHNCPLELPDTPETGPLPLKGDGHMVQINVGGLQDRLMVMRLVNANVVHHEGLLGLSFIHHFPNQYNNPAKEMAFVPNVLGKKFSHPVFALYLAGSELHLGEPQPGYYQGSIEYHKLVPPFLIDQQRWKIGQAVLGVDGDELILAKFETVFDIKAFHILGPPGHVNFLYKKLREGDDRQIAKGYENSFPCQKEVNLYLKWNGGRPWTISQDMFNLGEIDHPDMKGMCYGLFKGGDKDAWRLGSKFMRYFYLIFDATQEQPQLGIALLANPPSYDPPAYSPQGGHPPHNQHSPHNQHPANGNPPPRPPSTPASSRPRTP
ncbi:hypothetical protein APHAL10511_001439 [Amanita phalloides]|nr:hypothetical protein APHAL10511_001439 [Amanita phalloides]